MIRTGCKDEKRETCRLARYLDVNIIFCRSRNHKLLPIPRYLDSHRSPLEAHAHIDWLRKNTDCQSDEISSTVLKAIADIELNYTCYERKVILPTESNSRIVQSRSKNNRLPKNAKYDPSQPPPIQTNRKTNSETNATSITAN